jgi:hypothetical protein
MAPKFKMDAKTILSFKTCKFNYFFKFLQDYLNLANCSSFSWIFFFFFKFKMAKKFVMADFLHKNSWFFGSGTAEWNVPIFGYVLQLVLFYCKKIVASPKKSKRRHYSRWRRKCSYLSPNIFKNDIFVCISMTFF